MPITITVLLGKLQKKKEKVTEYDHPENLPTTLKTALLISSLRLPHL